MEENKNFNELMDEFETELDSCAKEMKQVTYSTESLIDFLSAKKGNNITNSLKEIQDSIKTSTQKMDDIVKQIDNITNSSTLGKINQNLDEIKKSGVTINRIEKTADSTLKLERENNKQIIIQLNDIQKNMSGHMRIYYLSLITAKFFAIIMLVMCGITIALAIWILIKIW